MDKDGIWLPIMEYSRQRNLSISSIRRYIKSNRVKFKRVDGKYFILLGKSISAISDQSEKNDVEMIKLENIQLRRKIENLEEENVDLKMLLTIYEGHRPESTSELPPLPQ